MTHDDGGDYLAQTEHRQIELALRKIAQLEEALAVAEVAMADIQNCGSCSDCEDDMEKALAEIARLKGGGGVKEDSALKPCPFCGSPADIRKFINTHGTTRFYNFHAQCCDCEAELYRSTKDAVIKAWNRRVKPPTLKHFRPEGQ